MLLGEIDLERTEPGALGLTEVSLEDILEKQVILSITLIFRYWLANTYNITLSPYTLKLLNLYITII